MVAGLCVDWVWVDRGKKRNVFELIQVKGEERVWSEIGCISKASQQDFC